MPKVTIEYNSGLDKFYKEVMEYLDDKYGGEVDPRLNFNLDESEIVRNAELSTHAAHAGNGVIIRGNMGSVDGGRTWQHIERLIK